MSISIVEKLKFGESRIALALEMVNFSEKDCCTLVLMSDDNWVVPVTVKLVIFEDEVPNAFFKVVFPLRPKLFVVEMSLVTVSLKMILLLDPEKENCSMVIVPLLAFNKVSLDNVKP